MRKTNKLFTKKATAMIMIFILFMYYPMCIPTYGATKMTDIRIGLTSIYLQKSSINIDNKKISFGYCIEDSYTADTELYSESGFTFQPATGYFYILDKTYRTYKQAKNVADTLIKLGVKAYPATIYRNCFKVYVGGEAKKETMSSVLKKIKGRFDYTYSTLQSNNKQRILLKGKDIELLIDGENKRAYPQFKAATSNQSGDYVLDLGSRSYRGRIEIGCYGKQALTAVNVINVESYLYGVVPSEMSSSWPMEALKAQAVCARSYALSKTGYSADSNLSHGYYLNDTISNQVYKGYAMENSRTSTAAKATKGNIVAYQGKMIAAYFFSTSGGRTESSEDVWGLEKSYYESVPDPYETEPALAPWVVGYTKSQILDKLAKAGFQIGSINSIFPEIITDSFRVYSLKVKGTKSNATLQSSSISSILDLHSTKFKIVKYGDNPDLVTIKGSSEVKNREISNCYVLSANHKVQKLNSSLKQYIVKGAKNTMNYPVAAPTSKDTYYFAGMGYGHGVGLSQSGAKGLAKAGYHYKEIIAYYFKGCQVKQK